MAKTTVLALVLLGVVYAQALEIPAISSVAENELLKPLEPPADTCPLINCIRGCDLDRSIKPCPKCVCPTEENCPTNGIFPIPGDCTAYIICWNGRERKRQCPEEFLYDSVMFCINDGTADCGFPPTPSGTAPLDDFCPRMYGTFADPDNCRQYVVCHEGRGIVHKCPEGTVYLSYAGCLEGDTCPTPDKLETVKSKETTDRRVCNLPPDMGPCLGDFPRFYYNPETNRCEGFTYGGCQGNGNNFKTKRKCKRTCVRRNDTNRIYDKEGSEEDDVEDILKTLDEVIDTVDTMRQVIDEQNINNRKTPVERMCDLPPVTGPCEGYFHRYYYDSKSGTCKEFIYGGCRGNENNFESLDECKDRCTQKIETSDERLCDLSSEIGPCQGYFPRYYYDSETRTCKKFIYGGCGGNENNFKTLDECKDRCTQKIETSDERLCDLSSEIGPCQGYFPRYYYDSETKTCQKFIYGGCGGNENNFKTLDECKERCSQKIETSDERICDLPSQSGPCDGYFPRYYYDSKSKTCEKFTFGGCGGNENNFETLDECKDRCVRELETEEENYKEFRCRKTGRFANPNSCDSYIECSVSSDRVDMELVQCPNYQHYNMETKQCDDKCNAQCDQTLACTCEWPHCLITCEKPDGLFPVPTNCRLYLQCRNSVPRIMRCPEEKAFDPELKKCVNIEDTNCEPKGNDVWSILKTKGTN